MNKQEFQISSLTQEKYDQLVFLLQQANLIPSINLDIGSSSNQLTTSTHVHICRSSDEKSTSGISSVIVCSISNRSHMRLLDLGANDHICFSLHFFESFYKIRPIQVHLFNGN